MIENSSTWCNKAIPHGEYICPDCKEKMKDMPIVLDCVKWRPFPLIEPSVISQEYLVTTENRGVCILLWDGYDWISTEDYFSVPGVIAWADMPVPYNL